MAGWVTYVPFVPTPEAVPQLGKDHLQLHCRPQRGPLIVVAVCKDGSVDTEIVLNVKRLTTPGVTWNGGPQLCQEDSAWAEQTTSNGSATITVDGTGFRTGHQYAIDAQGSDVELYVTCGEWRSFEGADKYIGGIWTDSQHDVYEGNWLAVPKSHQSTKDGRGRLLFANGDVFDGDWVNDVQCGEGTLTTTGGSVYTGSWADGKPHGSGSRVDVGPIELVGTWEKGSLVDGAKCMPSGDRVIGSFREGVLADGLAVKVFLEERKVFIGEWRDEVPYAGKLITRTGSLFEGTLTGALGRHGTGTNWTVRKGYLGAAPLVKPHFKTLSQASTLVVAREKAQLMFDLWKAHEKACHVYTGVWVDDKQSGGEGHMRYPDGTTYEGQWNDNLRHGKGKFMSSASVYHEGAWAKGMRHGKGFYSSKGDRDMHATWANDVLVDGETQILFANGDLYQGECVGGNPSGVGKMQYKCGGSYTGQWLAGSLHGAGVLAYAAGDTYRGRWDMGKRMDGPGEMDFATKEPDCDPTHSHSYVPAESANKFKGPWKDEEPHARVVDDGVGGLMVYEKDNAAYQGDFHKGKRSGNGELRRAGNATNAHVFSGEWDDDRRKGSGMMTKASGDILEGAWDFNVFTTGTVSFADRGQSVTGPHSRVSWGDLSILGCRDYAETGKTATHTFRVARQHAPMTITVAPCNHAHQFTPANDARVQAAVLDSCSCPLNLRVSRIDLDGLGNELEPKVWDGVVTSLSCSVTLDSSAFQAGLYTICVDAASELPVAFELNVKTGAWSEDGLSPKDNCGCWRIDNDNHFIEGTWVNGLLQGDSICVFADSQRFVGTMQDGVKSGQGAVVYPNGDRFKGEHKAGKRHGFGLLQQGNGDRYEGEWVDDVMCGRGTMMFRNGDRYLGSWSNNLANGNGTMTYCNGDCFDGTWCDGKRKDGPGVMSYDNGNTYDGEWQSLRHHGVGFFDCVGHVKYTYHGEWISGVMQGKGIQDVLGPKGHTYNGQWAQDARSGMGVLTDRSTEDKFTGPFADDDRRDGDGKMEHGNGDVFMGQFMKKQRHGLGFMTYYESGRSYNGDWVCDERHGEGLLTYKDQGTFKGPFSHNDCQSIGCRVFANENRWVGHVDVDGVPHGGGKMLFADASSYVGNYTNGVRSGKGKMLYMIRMEYSGDWADDKRSGEGMMHYPDGSRYEGQWQNDARCGEGRLCATEGYRDDSGAQMPGFIGTWENDQRHGTGIEQDADGVTWEGRWDHDSKAQGFGRIVRRGHKENTYLALDKTTIREKGQYSKTLSRFPAIPSASF